jgi:hypothetical protein
MAMKARLTLVGLVILVIGVGVGTAFFLMASSMTAGERWAYVDAYNFFRLLSVIGFTLGAIGLGVALYGRRIQSEEKT